MRTQSKAVAYGIAAFALAVTVIISGSAFGYLTFGTRNFDPRTSAGLSILLTDPPSIPPGVTAVYLTYGGLGVHVAGLGNEGWVSTGASGTIETLGLINFTQTISTGPVPLGVYDDVGFYVNSVVITFQGRNYSGTVNNGRLQAALVGGLRLDSSRDAAAVVDIWPTVLNLGSQEAPRFVVTTGAKAVQVPNDEVNQDLQKTGQRSSLPQHTWFKSFVSDHSDKLAISYISLTSTYFSLKITNPTSDSIDVRALVIAPAGSGTKPDDALGAIGGSLVFAVRSDTTLQPVSGTNNHQENEEGHWASALEGDGYSLAAGSELTFSFSGTLGLLPGGTHVTHGSSYLVMAMGENLLAAGTVIAG